MNRRFTYRQLFQPVGVFTMTLVPALYGAASPLPLAQAGPADAAAHTQMMNDASDAQEDFRFALTDKDQKAAVEALTKLERYMAQTEAYWSAKKQADGVTLAREALASASQSLTAAKANNLAAAKDAFDRMGVTCNSCHDLHLEKR